jgi:hypothetical protein
MHLHEREPADININRSALSLINLSINGHTSNNSKQIRQFLFTHQFNPSSINGHKNCCFWCLFDEVPAKYISPAKKH